MLDLSVVDLDDVATALEDHSHYGEWWIDGRTGEVWLRDERDDPSDLEPDAHPEARSIEPLPSGVGYRDMEEFIARVSNRQAAHLLERAIAGRGAFRRFKDALFEFPELRDAWFNFRDTRMRRRAIEFLVNEGLVDQGQADRALSELTDAPVDDGEYLANPRELAAAVAADLRQLYARRLVDVVVYGSQARGDAVPDSDLDLAVILNEVTTPWEELRRMDGILWRHTLRSGVTVSATPISLAAWDEARRPLVRMAKAAGIRAG